MMLATKLGKLLYANRVIAVGVATNAEGEALPIWHVTKLMTPLASDAMTYGELILVVTPEIDSALLNHETTHVKQWRRYGTLGFMLRYYWQFLRELSKLILAGNYDNLIYKAYYNITLEGEARANEGH